MSTTKTAPTPKPGDAIVMLTTDHKKVKELFKKFREIRESGAAKHKAELVKEVCEALTVHTTLEEEIFYPAVRAAIGDDALMDEALVEHAGAKELVAQLESMRPEDELYDAKVTVLSEQIDHHVKEEEGELFPKARKAGVDTATLGHEMAARKAALAGRAPTGNDDDEEESEPPRKRVGHR